MAVRFWPILLVIGHLQAQSSPQELANTILQRWTATSSAEFAAVYPFADGREIHTSIKQDRIPRTKGLANVVRGDQKRAVVLISGVPRSGNSGADTALVIGFSGMYEALAEGERWRLERPIPLEELGQILSHRLKVSLKPGHGLDVEDRLLLRVKTSNGFVMRLNHQAKLDLVRTAGADVRHEFGGGLLWADIPQGEAELTLKYSLEVEHGPNNTNSGCFTEVFGHLRDQYFWHPFFGFNSEADQADFQVEVRIPKEYALTTSLPQTGRIEGDERIVEGKSIHRTSALTLAYDREWKVLTDKAGEARLELFVTPAFRPDPTAVAREVQQIHSLLAGRFGEPSGYIAIVEARADQGGYWHFNSNQAVFAAGSPGLFSVKEENPRASLGHEIGHFWTHGSGPAANFLREGWATYLESLLLEREFGHDTVELFWKRHARNYFERYDGKAAMWDSGNGTNLNYDKGSWLFRMLEEAAGGPAFQKAMTEFSRRSLAGEAGWETLADCFQQQHVPDFDARQFLLPWLKEKSAPHLAAQTAGRTVTIVQAAPYFVLPVTVEATTAQGIERQRVWIRGGQVEVQFAGAVSEVRIDPSGMLLLLR